MTVLATTSPPGNTISKTKVPVLLESSLLVRGMSLDSTTRVPIQGKTIVLCFDGTSNQYNKMLVMKHSSARSFGDSKNDRERQVVYYQAGIGTYATPGLWNSAFLWLAKVADQAIAWYLDAHVMGGYEFLMKNYREGDKICLFGFSRGAYTARALAGMLHKVGLLPHDNHEQIPFAFAMFKKDNIGFEESNGFKETFSRHVEIEFVGVWDTVSSVGLVLPRNLPFTASNHIIRTFRHALALDERRAKFRANVWHKPGPKVKKEAGPKSPVEWVESPCHSRPNRFGASDWDDDPKVHQEHRATDVKEVWFAGCHSDVGGGNPTDEHSHSLADISLRWMVRECVTSQAGILFDNAALRRAGIPLSSLRLSSAFDAFKAIRPPRYSTVTESPPGTPHPDGHSHGPSEADQNEAPRKPVERYRRQTGELDREDATLPIYDSLKFQPLWWPLEFIPFSRSWQDKKGEWHHRFRANLFRPRKVRESHRPLTVHQSVKYRMEADPSYKPSAFWGDEEPTWVE